ncbi:(5-formylfuran-3-yl)methyl phosphate synthase [Roseiconus nitratireducens]|nr:(5-formylfuran-3-yl)methyl phosphate synthase [Roseiconus nitratireducens]
MPPWLISVRDLREARLAIRSGVPILDWKEPADGALAPVSKETWTAAADWLQRRSHVGGPRPALSAALGEPGLATRIAASVPRSFRFAKAGPSGLDRPDQLREFWGTLTASLPESVELVAVAYADHEAAGSLDPETILALAAECGMHRILIDTFQKSSGSSTALLGRQRLLSIGAQIRRHAQWWALAGSLGLADVQTLQSWFRQSRDTFPDCLAVRGAVCDGDRRGRLCPDRLRRWAAQFDGPAAAKMRKGGLQTQSKPVIF